MRKVFVPTCSGFQVWAIDRSPIIIPTDQPLEAVHTPAADYESQTEIMDPDSTPIANTIKNINVNENINENENENWQHNEIKKENANVNIDCKDLELGTKSILFELQSTRELKKTKRKKVMIKDNQVDADVDAGIAVEVDKNIAMREEIEESIKLSQNKFDLLDYIEIETGMGIEIEIEGDVKIPQ